MSSKLLVATRNQGKQKEAQSLLTQAGIEVVFPQDFPVLEDFDPPEDGQTFHENALQKARLVAEKSSQIALADDSGLEVVALDNAPGVHSKRFAPGSSQNRIDKILKLMKGKTDRRARFVTVLCLYDPQSRFEPLYFEGEVNGAISLESRGSEENGFEYDFIFVPNGYSKTFAELGYEIKNKVSHRARAFQKLIEELPALWSKIS